MATILYAWELGGGLGHILRFRPLGGRLISKGHRVVAALRELRHAETGFAGSKIEYFPAPHLNWRIERAIDPVRCYADILHNVGFGAVADLRVLAKSWQTLFSTVRPDLIVCDHAPSALLAASIAAVPAALIGTGFCCPPVIPTRSAGEDAPTQARSASEEVTPTRSVSEEERRMPLASASGLSQGDPRLADASASSVGNTGLADASGWCAGALPDLRPWWPRDRCAEQAIEAQVLANINEVRAANGKPPWQRVAELYVSAADVILTTFPELDHFADERAHAGTHCRAALPSRPDDSGEPSYGQGMHSMPDADQGPVGVHALACRSSLKAELQQRTSDLRPSAAIPYFGAWEPEGGQRFTWPSGKGPRIFMYSHRFRGRDWLLDHLRQRGFPAVVYTYDLGRPTFEKFSGSNVSLATAPLGIAQATAECDIAILNAGHNTAAQFLLAGKPLFLLPLSLEQGVLARRLKSQGFALSVEQDDPNEFRTSLDLLIGDDRYRQAAAAFADRYRSYDPAAAQSAIVERFGQVIRANSF